MQKRFIFGVAFSILLVVLVYGFYFENLFGITGKVVGENVNGAQFVSQEVPTVVFPNEVFTVNITVKNNGTTNWVKALNYSLGSQNPQDNQIYKIGRVELEEGEIIKPGETKTFQFIVTAPASLGNYNFQWRMLREHIEWFGDYSPSLLIEVISEKNILKWFNSDLPMEDYVAFHADNILQNRSVVSRDPRYLPFKTKVFEEINQAYWRKDSLNDNYYGEMFTYDSEGLRLHTESFPGKYHPDDVLDWDPRYDKFRLFASREGDQVNYSKGRLLAPLTITRSNWNISQHFNTYICNSFNELNSKSCYLFQDNFLDDSVNITFMFNFSTVFDGEQSDYPADGIFKNFDEVLVINQHFGLARERFFFARSGETFYGLVRWDDSRLVNGQWVVGDRAVGLKIMQDDNFSFDGMLQRALEDNFLQDPVICTPSPTNTSFSSWINNAPCQSNDLQQQIRRLTQYDSNNCGTIQNQTFYEYKNVVCDFCTPSLKNTSWSTSQDLTACQVNDTKTQRKTRIQYDSNNCGEIANQTFSETVESNCDYCLLNPTSETCNPVARLNLSGLNSKMPGVQVKLDSSLLDLGNVREDILTNKKSVEVSYKNTKLVFNHNFTKTPLSLLNFEIENNIYSGKSYSIVRNLNLLENKTIYLQKNNSSSNAVCIADRAVEDLADLENDCDYSYCDGSSQCSTEGNWFVISNLSHSGVSEENLYCGDGKCLLNETETNCFADCGVVNETYGFQEPSSGGSSDSGETPLTNNETTNSSSINQTNNTENTEVTLGASEDGSFFSSNNRAKLIIWSLVGLGVIFLFILLVVFIISRKRREY